MVTTVPPLDLNLAQLGSTADLSAAQLACFGEAASSVLEETQGMEPPHAAQVKVHSKSIDALLRPVALDEKARRGLEDRDEATEWGAVAVALMVVDGVLNRRVFARLPKGTGADYRMREVGSTGSDSYERLECSGIRQGDESTRARLRTKVRQLSTFPSGGPGYAVVVNFREKPVEIAVEEWRP